MDRHYITLTSALLFLFLLTTISESSAQTNTSIGGNWSTAGNWSLNQVPTAAHNVVINTNMTVNSNAVAESIIVNSGFTLTIGNNGTNRTVTVDSDVTVNGAMVVNAGANATHTLTIGGSLSNAGTFDMWANASRVCNVTINGSSISGAGAFTFNNLIIGAGIVDNSSMIDVLGNLTTNANATLSLSGASDVTVTGSFTMANPSVLDFGSGSARTVTIGGNLVTPRTITMTGAGLAHQLILNGAANAAPSTFNTMAGSGSTVEYGGAAQTVFASANYRNLKLSGSNTKTFSGATTINDDLDITGTGILVSNATPLTVNGNLTNEGSGTTTWGGNANTLTLNGNLLVTNSTTFTIGNTAAPQAKALNVSGNVQIDVGSTITVGSTANNAMSIAGDLLLDGTFNMVQNVTLTGTVTVGAGALNGSATSNLTIGGNNTPEMFLPPIGGGNLLSITLNKTGTNSTVNLGSPVTLATAGALTLTSGVLEIGNYNLTINNNTAAAIAGGAFSATKMISTNGTGYLVRNANVAVPSVSPIGAGGFYSPMTLTSIASNTGTYSIRAVPTTLNPTYISVYWDFVTSVAGKTITATFQYDPTQLNGASQVISYSPAPYTTIQSPPHFRDIFVWCQLLHHRWQCDGW